MPRAVPAGPTSEASGAELGSDRAAALEAGGVAVIATLALLGAAVALAKAGAVAAPTSGKTPSALLATERDRRPKETATPTATTARTPPTHAVVPAFLGTFGGGPCVVPQPASVTVTAFG